MSSDPSRCAVILTVDGLSPRFLGPYGNAWVGTPGFDRLACRSMIVEHALADDPQLENGYRAFWQGRHALCAQSQDAWLPELLANQGVRAFLVTDDTSVADAPPPGFEVLYQDLEPSDQLADQPEATQMAQFVDHLLAEVSRLPEPFLLWAHMRGMMGSWDCPYEMRLRYVDEGDPEPHQRTTPPVVSAAELDPDDLYAHQVGYAAQVALLDGCLAVIHRELQQLLNWNHTLFAVTSARGYPLGEHGKVGHVGNLLYGEQIHVPMFVVAGDRWQMTYRNQVMAQPMSVYGTLIDWFQLAAARENTGAFSLLSDLHDHPNVAFCIDGPLRGVRTPGWFLRQHQEEVALFVKPDDLWEVNEVSVLRRDVVDEMAQLQQQCAGAAKEGRLHQQRQLSALLLGGLV